MTNEKLYTQGKRLKVQENYSDAEAFLFATLKPVKPRPEFVQGLRGRLKGPLPSIRTSLRALQNVLFLIASVISSLVFLIAGVRFIVLLMKRFKLLRPIRNRLGNNITSITVPLD